MLRLLRHLRDRVTEIILSVALVLVSFLAILALLSWSFPEGDSLTQLMRQRDPLLTRGAASWSYDVTAADGSPLVIAELTRLQRRVKDKPFHGIAWADSSSGLPLYNRHSVQTFSRSGATITFTEDAQLELEENTLIVLRGVKKDTQDSRRASLVVLEGGLQATMAGAPGQGTSFEVVMPNGSANLGTATGGGTFQVAVNEDQSSTVTVLEGSAQVMAGEETLTLGSEQTLTISADGTAGRPAPLPGSPRVEMPTTGRVVTFRETPPRVSFSWEADGSSDSYEIQIARDPDFEEILHETEVETREFVHGNLKEGTYYWRVTGRSGWAAGRPSEARSLTMQQDLVAPALEVFFPQGPIAGETVVIRGAVGPGSQVFIGDTDVPTTDTGEFEHTLALESGINVVVVEAVDTAGNVTYESELLRTTY